MARLFWICLAGAVGTATRYFLSSWLARVTGPAFPFGTLTVNVIGSFLLGGIMQIALSVESFPLTLRLALTTGLLGGFTTYSSFNYETLRYFQEGAWRAGCLTPERHGSRLPGSGSAGSLDRQAADGRLTEGPRPASAQ
ncbi:MAG: fluoride exporter [Acidobacteriota bacterium]|jgi:CrcB protein|nr:fluoride exporter [Acidobacteriota bacterium]